MKQYNIVFVLLIFSINACDQPEHDLVIEIINNSRDTLLFESGFTGKSIDTSYFFTHNYFIDRIDTHSIAPDGTKKCYYISQETNVNLEYSVLFFKKSSWDSVEWKRENFELLISNIEIIAIDSLKQIDFKIYYY